MVSIHTETGRLRLVLMHRPGLEIDRVLPRERERLLFDDILFLEEARSEFDRLVAIIRKTGAEVLLFEELLDTLPQGNFEPEFSAMRIRDTITGEVGDPLPNLMFHRDLGAVIGKKICFTAMAEPARFLESQLVRSLLSTHPRFAKLEVIYDALARDIRQQDVDGRYPGLEGGDILCPRTDVLMVGDSIRSDRRHIDALAEAVLHDQKSDIRSVIIVNMPRARSYMHLDTIFTMISESEVLVHAPLILSNTNESTGNNTCFATRLSMSTSGEIVESPPMQVLEMLSSIGLELTPVICGGNDPISQHREQWTDGANAFCLAPGMIVLYRRNQATANALIDAGYEVMMDETFLSLSDDSVESLIASSKKIVILFAGNELSRARGGPRCLTLPLERERLAVRPQSHTS